MKFFHISDLHIGKQLYGYNLAGDQEHVLKQIEAALETEEPDALLLTGDIYDKPVPSGEAVHMFDRFLTEISTRCPDLKIMMIAGNHDAARRIDYASDILSHHNIHIAGTPPQRSDDFIRRVTVPDAEGEVDFYLLPFFKPANLRGLFSEEENEMYCSEAKERGVSEYEVYFERLLAREKIDRTKRNVLLTHQFFLGGNGKEPERTDSEIMTVGTLDHISSRSLEPFDYVAMGHLHRPQKCGKEIYRYCGTPMPYSLSEENDKKSVTVVTLEAPGKEARIETIGLKPLRRIKRLRGSKEELIHLAAGDGNADAYVSLVVTDDEPGRYVREELAACYSHILEIQIDNRYMQSLLKEAPEMGLSDNYFEMFEKFYSMSNGKAMSEEESRIIAEIMTDMEDER